MRQLLANISKLQCHYKTKSEINAVRAKQITGLHYKK